MEVDQSGFTRLLALNDLPPGEMSQIVFEEEELEVAVANADGTIYAFRDVCPHMMFPLSIGNLEGQQLECVGHGWIFDLRNGKAIYPPIPKRMTFYPVEIRDGEVWAKISLPEY